jgi:hypothetical protein
VKLSELADELNELVTKGHGEAEVRLRASFGERVQVRTGVNGIQHELKHDTTAEGDRVRETILLWGRSD